MSKYLKIEDIKTAIIELVKTNKWLERKTTTNIIKALGDLPRIEVGEDCIDRDLIINQLLNLMSVEKEHYEGMDKALKLIEHAPSVVPKQKEG